MSTHPDSDHPEAQQPDTTDKSPTVPVSDSESSVPAPAQLNEARSVSGESESVQAATDLSPEVVTNPAEHNLPPVPGDFGAPTGTEQPQVSSLASVTGQAPDGGLPGTEAQAPSAVQSPVAEQSSPAYEQEHATATAIAHDPQLETRVLPDSASTAPDQPAPIVPTGSEQTSKKRGTSKTLLSGLLIGAVVGGLVGGGTAAAVFAQTNQQSPSTGVSAPTVTINNPDYVSVVAAVAAKATPSVVTLQVSGGGSSGSGSGVIYSQDGYIITNSHVVTMSGATLNPDIRVRLSDGTMMSGVLVGTDPFADIAVVKVDGSNLPAIEVADSKAINVGDVAVAIGAPLNLSNTVTSGIVSALHRGISVTSSMVPENSVPDSQGPLPENDEQSPFPWEFQFERPEQQQDVQQQTQATSRVAIPVLQTDASINPGNSGGALLDSQGNLIGINVALVANGASERTAGSDGLGFAVPSNLAVRVADALIAGEQPSHGMLGVTVQEAVQDSDADSYREGALIGSIAPNSAAEQYGLRVGDVITAINGEPVDSSLTATALVRYYPGGSDVDITYSRGGELNTVAVKLGTLEW